jgi:hypothetical protein
MTFTSGISPVYFHTSHMGRFQSGPSVAFTMTRHVNGCAGRLIMAEKACIERSCRPCGSLGLATMDTRVKLGNCYRLRKGFDDE